MKRIWIITKGDAVIAAFSNNNAAMLEYKYLSYHGDGYKLTVKEIEDKAGGYAELPH